MIVWSVHRDHQILSKEFYFGFNSRLHDKSEWDLYSSSCGPTVGYNVFGNGKENPDSLPGDKNWSRCRRNTCEAWTLSLLATSACLLRRSTRTRVCRSDSCRLFNVFHKIKGRGLCLCCWAWALDSDATAEALCDPQRMPAESILPRKPPSQGPDSRSCCENLGAHLGANQTRKSVGPLIVTKFNWVYT